MKDMVQKDLAPRGCDIYTTGTSAFPEVVQGSSLKGVDFLNSRLT